MKNCLDAEAESANADVGAAIAVVAARLAQGLALAVVAIVAVVLRTKLANCLQIAFAWLTTALSSLLLSPPRMLPLTPDGAA